MIADFWNWSVKIADQPTNGGSWVGESETDEGRRVLFLMDPVDASPSGQSATLQQNCTISSTNRSNQSILIPLWIAWADQHEHPGLNNHNLALCARGQYNVGSIVGDVWIDDAPYAHISALMTRTAGNATNEPVAEITHNVNNNQNVIDYATTKHFSLDVQKNSSKPGVRAGSITNAGSHGYWVVHDPLPPNPNPHRIRYRLAVEPPGIGFAAHDFPNGFGPVEITYILNYT